MAQPIKTVRNNPQKDFSKELTSLFDFIISEIIPLYGTTNITPMLFLYGALEYPDSILFKVINTILNTDEISDLHDTIGVIIEKNDGYVNGIVSYSTEMLEVIDQAAKEKKLTESTLITSDHILLAILKTLNNLPWVSGMEKLGVTYDNILKASRDMRDIITNDIPKLSSNNKKNKKQLTPNGIIKMQIIGNPNEVPDFLNNLIEQISEGQEETKTTMSNTKGIEFCTNLNNFVQTNDTENLIGREKEINSIFNVLGRKRCNNVLLIGEQGVGKTHCVIGLAKLINEGNVPLQFRNKEIWKLNAAELVAGTQLRGMFEERIVKLVKQFKSSKNKILFIDELDNLFGSKRNSNGDYDVGGILSELFTDGNTQIIATVTYKGYKTISDENPEIAKKFQQITIDKPSIDECIKILEGIKNNYEKFHNVQYSTEIIKEIVRLSIRYITDKLAPSSCIDILDELGSYKKLNSKYNQNIKNINQKISDLQKQKNNFIKEDKIEEANDITLKISNLREEIAKFQNKTKNQKPLEITIDDVYYVLSEYTNIPISKLSSTEKEELKKISDTLKSKVIGQDEAIDIISRAIRRNKIGLSTTNRSKLAILAVGQSGVGKTMIAKTLAKEIFGDEKYLVRFDMSEYADETSVNKLIGSSAGYVGYTEGGLLTEAIKKQKYCVLLIDELEKANDKVFNIFLQVLDEGFLTDNSGQKVDFKNTIIIMTSNVGAKQAANTRGIGFSTNDIVLKHDVLEKELKKTFRPEFLNRLDDIVYFNNLTDENLKDIIKLELRYLNDRLNNIGHSLIYDDKTIEYLFNIVAKEKEYGARPIHRAIRDKIENKITDILIDNDYSQHIFNVKYIEEKGLEIV